VGGAYGARTAMKWTGVIRGMSRQNEIAMVAATISYVIALVAIAGVMGQVGPDTNYVAPLLIPLLPALFTFARVANR
jgi:hypothetical protein